MNTDKKVKLCNAEIERVWKTTFLGVVIDHKLNWKQHVEYVKGKISMSIAILYKTRYMLNPKGLYLLYYTIVLSTLFHILGGIVGNHL